MKKSVSIFIVIVGIFLFSGTVILAASFNTDFDVIDSFGEESASLNYRLLDAGGETAVGTMLDASSTLESGFLSMVDDYLVIAGPNEINLGSIPATGKSDLTNNHGTWNVKTNSINGYAFLWKSSSLSMNELFNGGQINAYTPAVVDAPESWSVAPTAAEWGGHLSASSSLVDTNVWGATDTYAGGKWLNIATTPRIIAQRFQPTDPAGDNETIYFGYEAGSNALLPAGTYTANIQVMVMPTF